ncbi:MAG: PhzF family phenazine biosynthesis protein [Deltaproteobacteria bacterium]|nr:PhzF family phenazine biosynthesis protein [Deltaproteobacteria bacterium]
MAVPIIQVDAFTDKAFSGNPAAVCVLDGPREDAWMQNVAAEMNLSETAFLVQREDGWGLRWFTPAMEVMLCGHASLASAHVLWEEDYLAPSAQARFHTLSGLLTADRVDGQIELDFPVQPLTPADDIQGLSAVLGVQVASLRDADWTWLAELEDPASLRRLAPNMEALRKYPRGSVIVTSRSDDPSYDFLSRFFVPGLGIDEDPVTGSSHCALTPYWRERLGKNVMVGYQASKRGGVIGVTFLGGRVKLRGNAVSVLRGELRV